MRFDHEGRVRAQVVSTEVVQASDPASKAAGIRFRFNVLAEWIPATAETAGSWEERRDLEVRGVWWTVRRDGSPNPTAVRQLEEALGDASPMTNHAGKTVLLDVKADQYKDRVSFDAAWMMPAPFPPPATSSPSPATTTSPSIDEPPLSIYAPAADASAPDPRDSSRTWSAEDERLLQELLIRKAQTVHRG